MEFEFNFGEHNIQKAKPHDPNLYASVAGTALQLGKDELVFLDRKNTNHIMTLQVLQAMSLTQQFKPMDEHVATIAENIPELSGQHEAIETVLGFLKSKGLLVSDQQWLTELKNQQKVNVNKYAGMVVRTCNRPEHLQRLIQSFENYQAEHGTQDMVLVFDDSNDAKIEEQNQKICQSAKVSVKYHGRSWQNQFIGMLKENFPEHSKQIDWLLKARPGFTGGRVWNLALLALVGKKFSFYDDDYLIQPRRTIESNEKQINLAENAELDVGFGLNIRDIKSKSTSVASDSLGAMVDACGQNFGQWLLSQIDIETSSLYGLRLTDLERFASDSVIKSTGNGTWGSPRAESNYWLYLLKGEQREAFWQDRETYLDNIEASHLLHYSPNYQALATANFAPSTIDCSSFTPFSMPINKNEDHFFNCMMTGCYPNQVALHFPTMMGHIQTSKRNRSNFNHIARKPNFNNFVGDFILSKGPLVETIDPVTRFQNLAAILEDLRTCKDEVIINKLKEYMTKTRSDLVFSLQNILDEVPDAPIYWQADIREIIQANGKAVKSSQAPVLTDWNEGLDMAACVEQARNDLNEVVQAMEVWPKLWAFCQGQ